ncbi:ClbS/DfsB family four-helix bundle protein [Microscilla marina]|uniref:Conserved protein n=1 Tax=Microscilla marina ATCC 23134 TaxID=313606 RepID=A1ZWL5_MICM2|nr:ClbS/DfsB family four-helix bundle protein [Microscilla marina]EAY25255.1 conserved protein [Microscilla marina ATCC 23134]
MPKPRTKAELLDTSQKNYSLLCELIAGFDEDIQNTTFPEGYLNRNIRDVLAHLHHWHLLMTEWYTIGMNGQKPAMPAEGYRWKDTPKLNQVIQKKYANTELFRVKILFDTSYNIVQKLILQHSNDELFEKKHYPWTGSTSLGAYLISATASHYDWAYKLIKKCVKQATQTV